MPPTYAEFRTGLTYRDVYAMLWSADPDPATWKYKRRGTVLGYWRTLKQQMYSRLLDENDT